ncbi:TPA: hypothetical protein N0F65_003672 [Lagenidium giganteum]|uniref:Uncharacterized protein n=1 Tax=Lagenidium giganteum TaxID=4803 RepID=A0AAV2YU44_9STRA|nr:TPA: hypothetical protein N0F65_003672 [Lagenidium giganteum]
MLRKSSIYASHKTVSISSLTSNKSASSSFFYNVSVTSAVDAKAAEDARLAAIAAASSASASPGTVPTATVGSPTESPLDFTGVYRDSNDDTSFVPSCGVDPVRLRRMTSDHSAMRESERKVEDFFRSTYQYKQGEDPEADADFARSSQRNRAKTAYDQDDPSTLNSLRRTSTRDRRSSTSAMQVVDLGDLKSTRTFDVQKLIADRGSAVIDANDVTRPRKASRLSSRLAIDESLLTSPERTRVVSPTNSPLALDDDDEDEDDGSSMRSSNTLHDRSATAHEKPGAHLGVLMENDRVINHDFTFSLASAPRFSEDKVGANGSHQSQSAYMHLKSPDPGRQWVQSPVGPNGAATPTLALPRLSATTSAAVAGKTHREPSIVQANDNNTNDELVTTNSKDSVWHHGGFQLMTATFSAAVATQYHRFSSSVRNTWARTGGRMFRSTTSRRANGVTSPQSECATPPVLARGYDDRKFYQRFADISDELKDILGRNSRKFRVERRRLRFIIVFICALLGIATGLTLIHIDSLGTAFRVTHDPSENQRYNGRDVVLAPTTRWLLFPAHLFLRLWNCLTLPLLFCQVMAGVSDLTMATKLTPFFWLQLVLVMLAMSLVATLQGTAMAVLAWQFKWFSSSGGEKELKAKATALDNRLGVQLNKPVGGAAFMCEGLQTYLQVRTIGDDGETAFVCSNTSIPLPVSAAFADKTNDTALFVVRDVKDKLTKQPVHDLNTSGGLVGSGLIGVAHPLGGSVGDLVEDLLTSLSPESLGKAFARSEPTSVVFVALVFALLCGKMAYKRAVARVQQQLEQQPSLRRAESRAGDCTTSTSSPLHSSVILFFVELQLVLEWLVDSVLFLAPIGMLFLFAAGIVAHRDEWFSMVAPMVTLVFSVMLTALVHTLVVAPAVLALALRINAFKYVQSFFPAFLFAFCTSNTLVALPITTQCFEQSKSVGRSMAQAMMAIACVFQNNGHALYLPLVMVFLTMTSQGAESMNALMFVWIGLVAWLSCFLAFHRSITTKSGAVTAIGGHGGSMVLIMTMWRVVAADWTDSGHMVVPTTWSLLFLCEYILSRFVAMVGLYDNLILTRIMADLSDETVIVDSPNEPQNYMMSPAV